MRGTHARVAHAHARTDFPLEPTPRRLRDLEGLRDWVGRDVAAAAVQSARERRSLDTFINELQDEVTELGDAIAFDLELCGAHLEEQSSAAAATKRQELAMRAEVLVRELEEKAPPSFRQRSEVPAADAPKSPSLPYGASVVVAGVGSEFGEALQKGLTVAGFGVRRATVEPAAASADPTLPPSHSLRCELDGADAIVLVCAGAVRGGVSPEYVASAARGTRAPSERDALEPPQTP